jgi:hypothetical protein
LRWDEVPHEELWNKTQVALGMGEAKRANVDALRGILKRRLPQMKSEDHQRYVELECARIVESLRVLRDTYRDSLKPLIHGPLAEMYWVVWQFGVRYRAVTLLQTAAITYVQHSSIPQKNWHQLFRKNPQFQYAVPATATEQMAELLYSARMQDSGDDRLMTSVTATLSIQRMVQLEALDATEVGGVFGRDQQFRQLEQSPGTEISPEALDSQLQCWDAARPWSEGLATLFDATQEEVVKPSSCPRRCAGRNTPRADGRARLRSGHIVPAVCHSVAIP